MPDVVWVQALGVRSLPPMGALAVQQPLGILCVRMLRVYVAGCLTSCVDANRTPVEDVIRLGKYKPEKYAVITTGDGNIMRSLELPAIRGAICYSQEAPLYKPLLAAYAAGDIERAKELAAYIGKSRAVTGRVNSELAVVPPGSPTAVRVPTRLCRLTASMVPGC